MAELRAYEFVNMNEDADDGKTFSRVRATETEFTIQDQTGQKTSFAGTFSYDDENSLESAHVTGITSTSASGIIKHVLIGLSADALEVEDTPPSEFFAQLLSGNDILNGSSQNDTLISYTGNDSIIANFGNDLVYGNQGDDTILGNQGVDEIYGGQGSDYVHGGDGEDAVSGNRESDTVFGGGGDDSVYGNLGADYVSGGEGDDYVAGQRDNDTLWGGDGADRFAFFSEGGSDVIIDYQPGIDQITIQTHINGTDISSFEQLTITANEHGDAVIALGGTDRVVLQGITPGMLGEDDFSFF